jgi:hypothetical protein
LIVDASAWCGSWPFSRLRHNDTSGLLHLMDRAGIDRALVSPLGAVFDRDCRGPNELLARGIALHPDRLSLVAVANPAHPAWEETLRLAVEELDAWALRLVPHYHGYEADSAEACDAARAAAAVRRPLYVTVRLQDERSHPPAFRVAAVGVEALNSLALAAPGASIIASMARLAEIESLSDNVHAEVSGVQGPGGCIERLAGRRERGALLFGSGAVLQIPECAVAKLSHHGLRDEDRFEICEGGVGRLFPGRLG